jgi:hemolysin activation/secretion protein
MPMARLNLYQIIAIVSCATPALAVVQVPLDRTDPGLAIRRAAGDPEPPAPAPRKAVSAPESADGIVMTSVVAISAIKVLGGDDLSADTMRAATESFIGHRLSSDDLHDLLSTVSGVARAKGYLFARSMIPAQAIGSGVLRVELDEGHIDDIRFEGADDKAVRAVLGTLRGHAPKREEVERQVLLAQDLPGVSIGQLRFVRENGKGILIVPITRNRVSGHAWADNWGDHQLGPVRAQLAVDLNGLVGDRDELSMSGLVTPLQPRELQAVWGRYAYQVNNSGTEIAVFGSYGHTRSGGVLRAFHADGKSAAAGASVVQPILRGRKISLWLNGELDYFAIDQWTAGSLVRRDRVTTANVSLNGYVPLAGGRLRTGVGVTRGLALFGATASGDPLASRPDAGGEFTMASAWANWTGRLAGPFSMKLAVSGQVASRPLLAINQIAIGGPVFGRAFDFSERSGDDGILGSAELQAKLWDRPRGLLRWGEIYTFADGGSVSNLRNDYGTGQLYSAGVGTRMIVAKNVNLSLEAAFPLNNDRFETGDKSARISASIASSF